MRDSERCVIRLLGAVFFFSILGFSTVAREMMTGYQLTVCPFSADNKTPDPLICHMHSGMLSSMLKSDGKLY